MAAEIRHESVYVTQTKTTSGLGIAALVLGLIACLGCWIPYVGCLSLPFAALGVFFGALGIVGAILTGRSYIGLAVAGTLVSITAIFITMMITGSIANELRDFRSNILDRDADQPDATYMEGETASRIRSSPIKSAAETKADQDTKEKEAYISQYMHLDFKVEIRRKGQPDQHPGVVFRLENKGSRSVRDVQVTVYLRDSEGRTIHEQGFSPMWGRTLPPGYVWDEMWREGAFTYYSLGEPRIRKAEYIPSEWEPGPGKASAKITDIEFAGE